MIAKKKLTPKRLVLRKWPKAHAYQWPASKMWVIMLTEAGTPHAWIGLSTAQAAWRNAADEL